VHFSTWWSLREPVKSHWPRLRRTSIDEPADPIERLRRVLNFIADDGRFQAFNKGARIAAQAVLIVWTLEKHAMCMRKSAA
jgi:hypothetical protein